MDKKDKLELLEVDVRALFITAAVRRVGCYDEAQIYLEATLTPGPIIVRGRLSAHDRKKKKFVDYVLNKDLSTPISLVK